MRSYRIIFWLFFLTSCVEAFDPEISSDEDILVVDGTLSNDDPEVIVSLSRTYPYDQNRTSYEEGAVLWIEDLDEKSWELTESGDGDYILESGINPEPGDYYRLRILTSDGIEYLSDYQEYLSVNSLDSILYREYRQNTEGSVLNKEGVEIYVNAHGDNDSCRYYRWEWEEEWEIMSPLNFPEPTTCWQSGNSSGININSTDNLYENELINQYLYTISFSDNKLAIRYRTTIKQYSVTRDNYIYLEKLEKINEGSGGFFDPIPAGLTGNVECLTNPDTDVLGFFEASEVVKKDIYIDRSELEYGYITTGFEDCEILYVADSIYDNGYMDDYYYVFEYYDSALQDTIVVMVNLRKCYDCGFVGEKNEPEGWIDD